MDRYTQDLKRVLDEFLILSIRIVKGAKQNESNLKDNELDLLAQKIHDLRHYSIELMKHCKDESTWHNAEIVKNLTESEIELTGSSRSMTSLIHAADENKNQKRGARLKSLVLSLAKQDALREVLLEDLALISRELAA